MIRILKIFICVGFIVIVNIYLLQGYVFADQDQEIIIKYINSLSNSQKETINIFLQTLEKNDLIVVNKTHYPQKVVDMFLDNLSKKNYVVLHKSELQNSNILFLLLHNLLLLLNLIFFIIICILFKKIYTLLYKLDKKI